MEAYSLLIQVLQWALWAIGGFMLIVGAIRFFSSLGDTGTGADRQSGGLTALGGIGIISLGIAVPLMIPAPSFSVFLISPMQLLLG